MRLAFFALLAVLWSSPAYAADLPTPELTPGAINPAVTQENIATTICVKGYTKTIRPKMGYTNALKRKQLEGYTDKDPRHYEEDHRVPLEAGGHPSDPRNLWPEKLDGTWGARKKDKLENYVHRAICSGKMTLQKGQSIFLGDWIDGYREYIDRDLGKSAQVP